MNKRIIIKFIFLLLLFSCKRQDVFDTHDVLEASDTLRPNMIPSEKVVTKKYSNARFREVTVERMGEKQYRIRGQGQIFEASFSWVIEDGHNELDKGFEMTDAGAPEWGNFEFIIEVSKQRENSTITLILFESSAKDGSRQYELPITLF